MFLYIFLFIFILVNHHICQLNVKISVLYAAA